MFMALMVVLVSQVYTYPQTHRTVYIKYVQLFICQSHLNKVVLKRWGSHTSGLTGWWRARQVESLAQGKLWRAVIEKQAAAEKWAPFRLGWSGKGLWGDEASQVLQQTDMCKGLSRLKMLLPKKKKKMLLPPSLPDGLGGKPLGFASLPLDRARKEGVQEKGQGPQWHRGGDWCLKETVTHREISRKITTSRIKGAGSHSQGRLAYNTQRWWGLRELSGLGCNHTYQINTSYR